MSKFLKDADGSRYRIDAIASIHPAKIFGEPRDQQKVTAVHTTVFTHGGNQHQTSIPFDEAAKLLDAEDSPA